MTERKLNGSVVKLAEAFHDVFDEFSTSIKNDMDEMESRLNKRIDITNENMQVQFAEQAKRFSSRIIKLEDSIDSKFKEIRT